MTFEIVFLSLIIALIISKTRAIVLRNNLDTKNEKRVLISGVLLALFFITNATLPYPQSLYWFIALGVTFTSFILSYNILRKEVHRFMELTAKSKVINVLFYSLLLVVTHIYL